MVQLLSEHDEAVIGVQEEVGVMSIVVSIGVAGQDQNFQKAVLVPFPFPFLMLTKAEVVQLPSEHKY